MLIPWFPHAERITFPLNRSSVKAGIPICKPAAHTLVARKVRPEEVPDPRLRSRFLDVAVCHVVPNGAGDYRQWEGRVRARR